MMASAVRTMARNRARLRRLCGPLARVAVKEDSVEIEHQPRCHPPEHEHLGPRQQPPSKQDGVGVPEGAKHGQPPRAGEGEEAENQLPSRLSKGRLEGAQAIPAAQVLRTMHQPDELHAGPPGRDPGGADGFAAPRPPVDGGTYRIGGRDVNRGPARGRPAGHPPPAPHPLDVSRGDPCGRGAGEGGAGRAWDQDGTPGGRGKLDIWGGMG